MTSNTISRRAALVGAAAIPAAVALPAIPQAAPASLRLNDDSPAAAMARAEHALDCLQARYVRSGWSVNAGECERVLRYFRLTAAAGKLPEDMGAEEAFAINFMYRHGLSTDWIFRGDVSSMICVMAAHLSPAAIGPDPIFSAIEAHRVATAEVVRAKGEEDIDRAADMQDEAAEAIVGVIPTTLPGALALMRYVAEHEQKWGNDDWPVDLSDPDIMNAYGKPLRLDFHGWLLRNVHETLVSAGA